MKHAHLILTLAVLSACLLNLLAASGGIVRCQGAPGGSLVEIVRNHGHCAPADEDQHAHEAEECSCTSCPCQDEPASSDIVSTLRDNRLSFPSPEPIAIGYLSNSDDPVSLAFTRSDSEIPPGVRLGAVELRRTIVLNL